MPTPAKPELTMGEAHAIIAVRNLLWESSRRIADRTAAGRHVATLLLDSSVEAAISVCLGRYGDSATERDTLADLHKRLSNNIKGSLPGWREVSRLRRVRNLAHHHQVPVDSEALAGFVAPVGEYIDAAIRLTFGFRLSDVVLADSIQDDDMRALVAEAEGAIDQADIEGGMSTIWRAFDRYSKRLDGLLGHQPFSSLDDLGIGRTIDSAIKPVREITRALLFTNDPGEYLWFERLRSTRRMNGASPATTDDARRALQFLASWIERGEAYARTHRELSERERAHFRPRAAASSDPSGRPEWESMPGVAVTGARVELAGRVNWGNGDEADDDRWSVALSRAILAQQWQAISSSTDVSIRAWGNEAGLSWVPSALTHPEVAEQVGAVLAGFAESFRCAVIEFEAVAAQRQLSEDEQLKRENHAAAVLSALSAGLGSDSPFEAAYADASLGLQVTLHAEAQPAAQAMFRGQGTLPLGNLFASGQGIAWLVPLTATIDAIVAAANEVCARIRQHQSENQDNAKVAADIELEARAIIAANWR